MILRKKDIANKGKKFVKNLSRADAKNGYAVVMTIIVTLLLALVAAVQLPRIAKSYDAQSSSLPESKITLDLAKVKAFEVVKITPEIIPGESITQKEVREKAEAEAKAQAELEKKKKSRFVKASIVARVYIDPSDFNDIYQAAANQFGVDANLLKAIHYVETGCSGSTSRSSYTGATGPMQFLPSTFRRHSVDGNNDGTKDINNVEDAIFSAAAYLKACGYPDVKKALWGYNPSTFYYNKVISVAKTFGMNI